MPIHLPKRVRRAGRGGYSQGGVSRIVDAALGLVFPASCAVCQAGGSFLCHGCEVGLARLERPFCPSCANPGSTSLCPQCAATSPTFAGIRIPYRMEGPVKDMVYNLKYRDLRASAPDLGRLIAEFLDSEPIAADVIVPVPLHRRKERERGCNQSALLAREVGKRTGIPVAEDVLRRTRDTAPQVSLTSPDDRRRNMEGAFECTGDVAAIKLLLLDDVVTTGSTMSACAAPLVAAGAASVWGVALARQA